MIAQAVFSSQAGQSPYKSAGNPTAVGTPQLEAGAKGTDWNSLLSRLFQGGQAAIGSQDPGAPDYYSGFGITPEQYDQGQASVNRYGQGENAFAGSTGQGPGAAITGQHYDPSGAAGKAKAMKDFLTSKKGMSPEQADRKIKAMKSSGGNYKAKGFKKWLKAGAGADYGLVVKKGKILDSAPYKGVNLEETAPDIRQGIEEANRSAVGGTQELIPKINQDIGSQLDIRELLRGQLGQELMGQSAEGLTAEQQQALNTDEQYQMQKYKDTFADNMKKTVGTLQGRGALRSSLLGDSLRRNVGDSYGEFLLGLQGNLAKQKQGYMNDAASRTAQRIGNLTSGYQVGGGTGGLGQLVNPYMNPEAIGKMTDAQSIEAILKQTALNMGSREEQEKLRQALYNKPIAFNQKQGGGIGSMIGSIAGGALGSVVPGVGTAIGSKLGGYLGGKV